MTEVSDALKPTLCFALSDHSALWGSVHLVAINPVLRAITTRLRKHGSEEHLVVELLPRTGANLSDLTVRIEEERGKAVLPLAQFCPSSARTVVKLRGEREFVFVAVESARLGRIFQSEPATFITSIHTKMNLIGGERHVSLSQRKKGATSYNVQIRTLDQDIVVGSSRGQTALRLLAEEAEALRRQASSGVEKWFSGDADHAQAALRDIIKKAERRVLLVDYFFAAPEVILFIPAVTTQQAEIRVLTSKEGLAIVARTKAHTSYRDELKRLVNEVDRVAQEGRMQRANVRYMTGDRAAIHDRFLQIDDDVYLLGSSLNEYGTRGTMLVQLRKPVAVLHHLSEEWERASDARETTDTDTRS